MRGLVLAAVLLAGSFWMVGCGPSHARRSAALADSKAVYCPKCQVLWTTTREYDLGLDDWVEYRMTENSCPDCRSAVVNFFTTGELKHTCKTCGESLRHCTVHRVERR